MTEEQKEYNTGGSNILRKKDIKEELVHKTKYIGQ